QMVEFVDTAEKQKTMETLAAMREVLYRRYEELRNIANTPRGANETIAQHDAAVGAADRAILGISDAYAVVARVANDLGYSNLKPPEGQQAAFMEAGRLTKYEESKAILDDGRMKSPDIDANLASHSKTYANLIASRLVQGPRPN